MAPWLKRGPIGDDILKKIYASDQDMYPAPLTYSWLKSWVSACPDLSLCFSAAPEDNGGGEPVPVGAVIVLPLKKEYWEAVLTGKLKETSIDASTMFAGSTELVDVGLHVFHIERFKQTASLGRLRHFAEFALEDTREIVDGKPWNILGYSGMNTELLLSYREHGLQGTMSAHVDIRWLENVLLTKSFSSHSISRRTSCLQTDGVQGDWLRRNFRNVKDERGQD